MSSLSAILFTDLVRSTELAAELRDDRWNDLRRRHDAAVRRELGRRGGREINTAGDAFVATFDEPERAIACAWAVRDAVRDLGLEIRMGIHFGRLQHSGRDVGGIALHIAARVLVAAQTGEILVSSTVRDALAGSGVEFDDRGPHELKGLPGEWRLYSVRELPSSAFELTSAVGWRAWTDRGRALLARGTAALRPAGRRGAAGRPVGAPDSSRPGLAPPDEGQAPASPAAPPSSQGRRTPWRTRSGRASRNRGLNIAACLVVLALGLWGLVAQRHVSRLPADAMRLTLAYPVTLGDDRATSAQELEFLVQRHPPGTRLSLRDAAGTALHVATEPRFPWEHLLVTAVCGLAFWVVGAFVFGPRMEEGYIPAFFWAFLLYATAILIGGVYFPPEPLWPNAALPLLRIASLVLLPFLFAYIGLIFPRRQRVLETHRWLVPAAYGGALLLVGWHAAAFLEYVVWPHPDAWRALRPPELFAGTVLLLGNLAGCSLLYRSLRRAELDREKRQTKWILWGMAMGVSPFAFLYVLPQMLGFGPLIPLAAARLATFTIPVAFAIAVAKHKFLDIDIIIRRSLIYASLAAFAGGLYLLVVVWAARRLADRAPAIADLLPIAATALVVALLAPTRRAIGRWVDRTFFGIGYRHGRALQSLRHQLERVWSQREVAAAVRSFLESTLRPTWAAVAARAGDELVVNGAEGDDELVGHLRALCDSDSELVQRPLAAPHSTSLPERETSEFPPELLDAGVLLVYPLSWGSGCLGWILLGEKASERRFVREDLELLDGVSSEAAAALEHLDLVQRVTEERLDRQRLKDLDRSKTEFLMRVAHDLRTPLASISWSAQNLADGVVVAPDPRQTDYLRAITSSANRLSRLVDNLLEVSRLDGVRQLHIEPVELAAVVGEAIDGLRPIAESRAQRLELRVTEPMPPAHGNAPALVEVATNLLENALKYSPAGSTVEVEILRADGGQAFAVRDHGPGLSVEGQEIFDAFRQGAPSPHSGQRGFGLGLFIVRSYVQMLGGTVTARTEPSGGARFTVTLRDFQTEAAPT